MADQQIVEIPLPEGITKVPSGAVRFGNNWTGLYLEGQDALSLMMTLNRLTAQFKDQSVDMDLRLAIMNAHEYAETIRENVVQR